MSIQSIDTEKISIRALARRTETSPAATSLKIGLPRETSPDERRLSLTPGGVSLLCANEHEVLIEEGAGDDAGFSDQEYAEAGAEIIYSPEKLYRQSHILLKISPPTLDEVNWMHSDQALISALHLGYMDKTLLQQLIDKGIHAVGYEFIRGEDSEFPIVRMMHEITGSMAIQIAAHYLENRQEGLGIMLGGISGIPPATVVILGAGIIGEYAARTALGYGAQVFVMDNDLTQLRRLENALDRRIITATANQPFLTSALSFADVLIGAALVEGERAPCWVTDSMVSTMKRGSVVVDAVVDQGGCIDTSHATSHSDPVFSKHGVIHYCVPNIPSSVARTATFALNNVLTPYLLSIGEAGGFGPALWKNIALRNGTYIYKRHLTKQSLAERFQLDYRDIEMLIASRI